MSGTIEKLAAVGNVVDDDYHHVTKKITPRPAVAATDVYLRSARDVAAKRAYVESQFAGTI